MGGGVSKDLIEENKRLKRLVKELNDEIKKQASQSSSDDNISSSKVADQRSTIISDSPPKKNAGVITRRGEVSAEVREISGLITNYEKVNIKKSSDIRQLLITAVEESLLFNSMGEEEKSECVDAFIEQKYKCGDSIIKQNDVGNDFYIIGTGTVEVLLKTLGSKGYLSKGHLSKGQSFGELALLYNTPRAATIIAQTDVALWVLSRQTFVTISTYFKHQRLLKYQTFLQEVDVFKSMKKKQLLRVAEALEPEKHAAGDAIILQGEKGNHFYLIAKGTVKYQVTNAETKEVKDVGSGTIGNFFGERALMDENDERKGSVYATTDVELLVMERAMFQQLLKGIEFQSLTKEQKEAQLRDATRVGKKFHKEIALENLIILRTLGEGAFGRVRLVQHKDSSELYALKYLSKEHISSNALQAHVINERNIMMMIDTPFVLKLYNTYQDTRYLYFLVELIHGGELFTLLRDLIQLSEKMARFYAGCVVQGFEHLHERDIVYRDLKPENLLLNKKGYIKIVDLGLAKVVKDRTYTLCGTPEYLAPEVILNKGHDRGVDNWGLGILIFEMVNGDVPFEGESSMETYSLILKDDISFTSAFSRSCKGIIRAMCQQNPKRRIGYSGFDDIRRHYWYAGFDWKAFIEMKLSAPHVPSLSGDNDLSNFDEYDEIDVNNVPQSTWTAEFL